MGKRIADLTGQVFGQLTAEEKIGVDKGGRSTYRCSCSCGKTTKVDASRLIRGHTKSCGHLADESRKRVATEIHKGKGSKYFIGSNDSREISDMLGIWNGR